MDKFQNQILKFIRENELLGQGDAVTVGFSGGADSVCLLTVLRKMQALLKIRLQAVHVNHQLRGEEAERDEAFCEEMAKSLGIPFVSVRVDVRGLMEKTGMSEEEAGRTLRYEALREAASAFAADSAGDSARPVLAVAHHADDQAETILLNMLRGSGLRGLSGMRPKRDDIVRPLLSVSRSDILQYLSGCGIPYVDDSTNFENEHTRNRLRNMILPELKEYVNERAAEHIAQVGALIRESDEYLAAEANAYLDSIAPPRMEADGCTLSLALNQSKLKEKAQVFRRYVIIEGLRRLKVPLKDWGEKHFSDADRALFGNKGYHVDLPGGACIDNAYKETFLCVKKSNIPSGEAEHGT